MTNTLDWRLLSLLLVVSEIEGQLFFQAFLSCFDLPAVRDPTWTADLLFQSGLYGSSTPQLQMYFARSLYDILACALRGNKIAL